MQLLGLRAAQCPVGRERFDAGAKVLGSNPVHQSGEPWRCTVEVALGTLLRVRELEKDPAKLRSCYGGTFLPFDRAVERDRTRP